MQLAPPGRQRLPWVTLQACIAPSQSLPAPGQRLTRTVPAMNKYPHYANAILSPPMLHVPAGWPMMIHALTVLLLTI